MIQESSHGLQNLPQDLHDILLIFLILSNHRVHPQSCAIFFCYQSLIQGGTQIFCIWFPHIHTLEEIVSKSTLLCGDRTQENA